MAIRIISITQQLTSLTQPNIKHEVISSLDWIDENTRQSGRIDRTGLHDWIKYKNGQAYVKDNSGDVAFVAARENTYGTKYVQTYADGIWKDNLLALPRR